MDKVYNFSAGPTALPEAVLKRVKEQIFNYKKRGISVMELAPGTRDYNKILKDAETSLRRILEIPTGYTVLFLGVPTVSQYSAVPINLMSDHRCADYIVTGQSSKMAESEAKKYGDVLIAASSAGTIPLFSTVPRVGRSDFRPDADYVYLCHNDSIYGTKFPSLPDTGSIPLVVDMTSSLLSEPVDWSRIALLIAGGECNIGVPGMTLVIIRDDLIGSCLDGAPSLYNYKYLSDKKSLTYASATLDLYIAGQVFEWIDSVGGLEEMKRRSEKKASLLYDYFDGQSQIYYTSSIDKTCRSSTVITFTTGDAELDRKFIAEAADAGFINLQGQTSVGGMRAAVYNSMPHEGVVALVEFMKKFKNENPKFKT